MNKHPFGTFVFDAINTENIKNGNVSFLYRLTTANDSWNFCETVSFETKKIPWEKINMQVLENTLFALHLFLGISYWKITCAPEIIINSGKLSEKQAQFWNTVYTKGLGQFHYENGIDFRNLILFPVSAKIQKNTVTSHNADLPAEAPQGAKEGRALLLIGGGKDSLVSAELLKKHDIAFSSFTMGESIIQHETILLIPSEEIILKRAIDRQIIEINKRSDVFNGHIPISIGYTLTALLASVLYDFNSIIASNEVSANIGNLTYLDTEINHQWSKSFECEMLLHDYIQNFIANDLEYFSLLRPLHEIKIVQLFTKYEKYFQTFSSCNKNFLHFKDRIASRWCGECPKCAFVFLLLAAFLPKETILKIFAKNLFADENLVETYRELFGIKGVKPFECVGTKEESIVAGLKIRERDEYQDDPVMKMFEQEVYPVIDDAKKLEESVMKAGSEHHIPEKFQGVLKDFEE